MYMFTHLLALTLCLTCFVGKSGQDHIGVGPGSPCSQAYKDQTSCNTTATLLACLEGSKCGCLEDISNLPYLSYSYTIDMEWNSTAGKCVSRMDSVCNMVEGAENDILLGHLSTIPCMNGTTCRVNTNYPPEHGTCRAPGFIAMNSLITICVGFLFWG